MNKTTQDKLAKDFKKQAGKALLTKGLPYAAKKAYALVDDLGLRFWEAGFKKRKKRKDPIELEQIPTIPLEIEEPFEEETVHSVAYQDRDATVATSSYSKVRLWRLDGSEIASWKCPGWVEQTLFHPRGDLLATCDLKGRVCLWHVPGGALRTQMTSKRAVNAIAFNSDGSWPRQEPSRPATWSSWPTAESSPW